MNDRMKRKDGDFLPSTYNPRREKFLGLWLILPAMIILVFFNIYPFIQTVRFSFFNWVLTRPDYMELVGFSNYIDLFKDHNFWVSLGITLIYIISTVTIQMLIGFWLARILNQDIPGRNIFTSIFLIPMVMSPVVVGLFWRAWFAPDFGLINYFLKILNLGHIIPAEGFIGSVKTALPVMILVDIWQWTSFVILIVLAGLKSLPLEPFEASEIDGASGWQKLRFITFPLLKPILLVVILFRTMDAYRIFDVIWVMSKGGPGRATETLSIYVYKVGFYYWNIGYATSMTMIMLIIAIIAANIMIRTIYKEQLST